MPRRHPQILGVERTPITAVVRTKRASAQAFYDRDMGRGASYFDCFTLVGDLIATVQFHRMTDIDRLAARGDAQRRGHSMLHVSGGRHAIGPEAARGSD
jgi:hypothetical protein